MTMKWIKTPHKGLRYYEHATKKHGKKRDRYYAIRFKVDNKDYDYGIGWWSDGIPEEARRNDPSMGFEEYALAQLKLYKANIKAGSGVKSPKEKRQIAKEEEVQKVAEQARRDKESITFADYFKDTYLPDMSGKKSIKVEQFIYDKWIDPVLGKIKINQITDFHLQKIKKTMQDNGKAVRTIHYAFAIVSQVWNKARKAKIVQRDCPTRDVTLPRIDNQKKRALTKQEASDLLAYLKNKSQQLYELAYLSLYTGARFSELAGLIWRRVNVDDGSIIFRNTKSGKDRTIFMTDGIRKLFAGMKRGLPDSLIFTGRKEKRLFSVSHTFDRAIADLGLNAGVVDPRERLTFHNLRHSHASWLVDSGVNLYLVKEILGHADFKMTTRYSHPASDSIRQAMVNLEKYVEGASGQQQAGQVVNLAK